MNLLKNFNSILAITENPVMKDARKIFTFRSVALLIALIGNIIVARTLGPSHKGMVDLFTLILSLIGEVGLFGFSYGLLYYLTNKKRPLREVHGTGLVFSLAAGTLVILVGYFTLEFWQRIFSELPSWVILLAFIASPILFYKVIWENIMTGINRAVNSHKMALYFSGINLLAILILYILNLLNYSNLILLVFILILVNGVVSLLILLSNDNTITPSVELARNSFKYGIVIYIGSIANLLHFKIDQTMLAYWMGVESVGIYTVSVRWAEMQFFLDQALISAAFYKITTSSTQEGYKTTKSVFQTQFRISMISGVALALIAYPLILYLYGEPYKGSILPLIILIPGIIGWSVSKVISNMLTYNLGMASFLTWVSISGCILNILLNYIFIKWAGQGVAGAALASTISYLLAAILIIVKARTIERNHVSDQTTN